MTDEAQGSAEPVLTGSAFLYEQPELLTAEQHGGLGISPIERPYDFVRNVRAIPVTLPEFATAQRHYPIVFTSMEDPVPLAVTAVLDETNLFVDAEGQWDAMCYVPSYLRCYPFGIATDDQGRGALLIDRKSGAVTDEPRYPFFEGGQLAEHTKQMLEFCTRYEAERIRTRELCERLRDMELLMPQQATYTPQGASEPQPLASYVCIDAKKLTDLDKDTIYGWHRSGELSCLYSHLHSLDNWRALMARRQLKGL